ncbi:MAG: hypothetical protein FWE03_05330 [Firmicutes bacterium]|nr:hypothetical protein [Bacillota bacterium]
MKTQKCKNCTYYTAYYKQWAACYSRLNNGFCTKHNKHQTQVKTCEDFKSNERKKRVREKILFEALAQSINSINDIAQILKEREVDGE